MLSGSGHLSISQGDQESLTIEADDNLLPLIQSRVADRALHLGPEHGSLAPTKTIRYRLQLKNLKELHLSGSLDAEAESIKTDQLVLRISGSGDIELGGKADRQQISISGSGNYRAGDCASQNTTVDVSGSGDATVWARLTLDAHVSGSGDISYYGSPRINSHVSGSGGIHQAGDK